jgi:hypothetical protein
MRTDGKDTKQKAQTLTIGKLSCVANPAHEGALAKLLKSKAITKGDIEKQTFMDALRGEQIEQITYEFMDQIWDLNYALKTSIGNTIKDEEIEDKKQAIQSNISDYVTAVTTVVNSATFIKSGGEAEMGEKALQKQLDDLQAKLDRSESINKMDGPTKTHFDSLDTDNQDSFLAKSESERAGIISKAAEDAKEAEKLAKANEETFTSNSGQVIMKSEHGESTFRILKDQDEQIKKGAEDVKIEKEKREIQEFSKRAEDLFPNLPGDPMKKGQILKSIEEMTDKDAAATMMAMLKSGNETNSVLFKELGVDGDGDVGSDAESKLNKMAEEIAKVKKITFAKAYVEALATEEGADLYEEIGGK